jgi:hypothetical protein
MRGRGDVSGMTQGRDASRSHNTASLAALLNDLSAPFKDLHQESRFVGGEFSLSFILIASHFSQSDFYSIIIIPFAKLLNRRGR